MLFSYCRRYVKFSKIKSAIKKEIPTCKRLIGEERLQSASDTWWYDCCSDRRTTTAVVVAGATTDAGIAGGDATTGAWMSVDVVGRPQPHNGDV